MKVELSITYAIITKLALISLFPNTERKKDLWWLTSAARWSGADVQKYSFWILQPIFPGTCALLCDFPNIFAQKKKSLVVFFLISSNFHKTSSVTRLFPPIMDSGSHLAWSSRPFQPINIQMQQPTFRIPSKRVEVSLSQFKTLFPNLSLVPSPEFWICKIIKNLAFEPREEKRSVSLPLSREMPLKHF